MVPLIVVAGRTRVELGSSTTENVPLVETAKDHRDWRLWRVVRSRDCVHDGVEQLLEEPRPGVKRDRVVGRFTAALKSHDAIEIREPSCDVHLHRSREALSPGEQVLNAKGSHVVLLHFPTGASLVDAPGPETRVDH